MMKNLFLIAVGLAALVVIAGQAGLLGGQRPDLGVVDGRLQPPSPTPNSVSSQTHLHPGHPQAAYAAVEPLPLKAAGAAASLRVLADVLQAMPGVTVVEQKDNYLRAQAQTRWLKFIDDLEFWIDPQVNPQQARIEVRSASRLGRKDFGVNRARLEAIRAAYLAAN